MKIFKCPACHRQGFRNRHHLDYESNKTIVVCAGCHKKIHMYLRGTVRTGSNPYMNPLIKLGLVRD